MTPDNPSDWLWRQKHHDFAVVDRLTVEEMPDIPHIDLVPKILEGDAAKLPCLLLLSSMSSNDRTRLFERNDRAIETGDTPLFRTLLATDVSAEYLARHLCSQLVVELPQGRFLLRYYDPRVMHQLAWMLSPARFMALLGPVRTWTMLCGKTWMSAPCPSGEDAPRSLAPISRKQGDRLLSIDLINAVIAQSNMTEQVDRQDSGRRIYALLGHARQKYGFLDDHDLVAFAQHGLRLGEKFDEHPRVLEIIASLDDEISFRDACDVLDEDVWQSIRTDLENTRNTISRPPTFPENGTTS